MIGRRTVSLWSRWFLQDIGYLGLIPLNPNCPKKTVSVQVKCSIGSFFVEVSNEMIFMRQIHAIKDNLNGGEKIQPCVFLNAHFVGKRKTNEELQSHHFHFKNKSFKVYHFF